MDPNLLSMIWWGIPALAGFALMFCSVVALAWLAIKRSDCIHAWFVAGVFFLVSHAIAWGPYTSALRYGRLWCGADPEPVATSVEVR